MRRHDRAFHEKAALDLLARDGISVIWKLHLDAANAYRGGFFNGARLLLATADAAERLIRHTANSRGGMVAFGFFKAPTLASLGATRPPRSKVPQWRRRT